MLRVPQLANITGLGTSFKTKSLLQSIVLFLHKVALNNSSFILFQNEPNKLFFEKHGVRGRKHKLIPGSGVNLDYFYKMEYPKSDKIEFLFIGRIMKEKGIEQYIETARYIKNKYPNTLFHIVGSFEDDYAEVIKGMEDEGIIKYHGRQNDVREFHKLAHCIIHPTYYPEGMSNVLLESAASGRPIITTEITGCKEIVDDRVNGLLVRQNNTKDLISKVEEFLNLSLETKKQMGINGRKKVEKSFSRQIVVEEYVKEISQL